MEYPGPVSAGDRECRLCRTPLGGGAGVAVLENLRAQMRVLVKHILKRYGYPPDKQAKATETVLEQAEVLLAA